MSYIDHGQNGVSECIKGLMDGSYTEPFSYLLTAKQTDVLEKRFREALWPVPQCKFIEVSLPAIAHTAQSRITKDGLTPTEIGAMLAAIFRKDAEVAVNPKYTHQFHLVNSRLKLKDGQMAIGCFQVNFPQGAAVNIGMATAYLAVPAKALGLLGKGKK